jgi:hypothetical protein
VVEPSKEASDKSDGFGDFGNEQDNDKKSDGDAIDKN